MENEIQLSDEKPSKENSDIRLQLGDIIQFVDEFETSNNGIFLIEYIDDTLLKLRNENGTMNAYELDDGYIVNTTINEIHILSRAESPSWIVQNNYKIYDWINIYIEGDVPVVLVGQISNIEEDMMEIISIDKNTFYLNFDYKGIPLDIPITKIELNTKLIEKGENITPLTSNDSNVNINADEVGNEVNEDEERNVNEESDLVDEISGEVNVDDGNDEFGYDDETPVKKLSKDVLDKWIREGDKILMSKDVQIEEIDETQRVDASRYQYDEETQLNDLMNDLLTSVSVEKQTPEFINEVHTLVERYKQLVNEPRDLEKTNPLVDNLQTLKKFIHWILPVCTNVKIIYKDNANSANSYDDVIEFHNQVNELENILRMFQEYKKRGDVNDVVLKYDEFLQTMNTLFTPFLQTTNEYPTFNKILYESEVQDQYVCLVNTTGHMYSNVYSSTNEEGFQSQRFMTQRYNTEIERYNASSITSSTMTGEIVPVTNADTVQITSIMTLPRSVLRYSRVGLRGTSIITKTNLSLIFLDYTQLLNHSQLRTVEYNNLSQSDTTSQMNQSSFLKYPTNYTTTSSDYKSFLKKIIPNTSFLINGIKRYFTNEISTELIIRELEPFLIYSKNIDSQDYKEINRTIHERIKIHTKYFLSRKKAFSPLKYIYSSKNSIFNINQYPSCNIIFSLLRSKHELDDMLFRLYGINTTNPNFKWQNTMTNTELLSYMMDIDNAKAFYITTCILGLSLHIAESMMMKIHKRLNDVINNTSCESFIISKMYNTEDEMKKDNHKTIYYDRNYDNTDYSILSKYRKEQNEMSPPDFEHFLNNRLIQKHKVNEQEAGDLASTIILGSKIVRNGDHAILYGSENIIYLVRENNEWKIIPHIDSTKYLNEITTETICNAQPTCIYDTKIENPNDSCISVDENKRLLLNHSLKIMMKEFDETVMKDVKEIREIFYDLFLEQSICVGKLRAIKAYQNQRYSIEQYNYGMMYLPSEINIQSPYEEVCKHILAETDLVKKYTHIIKFCLLFTRPGNEQSTDILSGEPETTHWLYCNRSNVRLIPTFYNNLATAFIEDGSDEYEYAMNNLIQRNGVAIDDAWYDKFTGRKIKDLDYDVEEGYDNGFKRKTRDVIEEDLGNILFNKSLSEDDYSKNIPKQKMTKKTIPIFRIIQSVENNTGADLSGEYDFIVSLCLQIVEKIVPSEKQHEDMIAKMAKKGKKIASYDDIYYKTLVYTTLGIILICIQTSIPSIKILKKGYPGCNRSFKGFPLELNSVNLSGIHYISCTAVHSRVDSYPWKVLSKNQEQVSSAIKLFIEQHLIENVELKQKLEFKRNYISLYEIDSEIPEELNIMNLPLFLPPLKPLKMKQVELINPSTFDKMKNKIRSGSSSQLFEIYTYNSHIIYLSYYIQFLIQNIVSKNPVLLLTVSNKPYMENSCCDEGNITPILYFSHLEPQIQKTIDALLSDMVIVNYIQNLTIPSTFGVRNIETSRSVINTFSESTIYRYFSFVCNFKSELPYGDPLIEKWCGEKPDYLVGLDTSKQLEIVQQKHVSSWYNKQQFIQLLQYISSKNILPPIQPTMKLEDFITNFKDSETLIEKIPFMKTITERMNILFPEYFHFVKKQTQEVVEYINTFVVLNKRLRTNILEFMKKQKRRDQEIKRVSTFLDTMSEWKCESTTTIDYYKNWLRNIILVFPFMIVKNNYNVKYNDNRRNNFSNNHYRDIYSFLSKYYDIIEPFCNKPELKPLLFNFNNKLKHITTFLDSYIMTKDKQGNLTSPFGERSSKLLFENIILETLSYLINLTNKKGVGNFTPSVDLHYQYDYINDDEESDIQPSGFQEFSSEQQNIERGNTTIVKNTLCDYIAQITVLMVRHKNMINVTNDMVKSRVFKNAEVEKHTITDRLKDMSVEQRNVENTMKINKLGEWSVGLAKGIRVYDQTMYDRERRLFKDIETESDEELIEKLKNSSNGLDITEQDKLNEMMTAREISAENNDMSSMGEDYDTYYMYEEDDDDAGET